MNENEPLMNVTAAELMSRDVLTISEKESLRHAARLLARAHVTGAPVTDESGRCVGVLSATDFLRCACKDTPAPARSVTAEPYYSDWCVTNGIEELPEEAVSCFMTRDVVTVPPTTPLPELARRMVDGHIHRLIVVNAAEQPIGVVSSMDILAAVTRLARPLVNA